MRTLVVWCAVATAIAAWSAVVALGIHDNFSFLGNTGWKLEARKGSEVMKAIHKYGEVFPQRVFEYPYAFGILVESLDPTKYPVTSPHVETFTHVCVNATVLSCTASQLCWWRQAKGFFLDEGKSEINRWITADKETATIIVITTNHHFDGSDMQLAWTSAESRIMGWASRSHFTDHYRISFTHEEMLLREASATSVADFERGDMITLPIAWVMLWLACGPSASVLVFSLPVTFIGVFYTLGVVANMKQPDGQNVFHFASFTPAIFVNFSIAISLDYFLFLVSSFQRQLEIQESIPAATSMMRNAGKVVLVSGSILAFSFLGLAYIDEDIVRSIGIGGFVITMVCMLANLTLVPSLLLMLSVCPCTRKFIGFKCRDASCCNYVHSADASINIQQQASIEQRLLKTEPMIKEKSEFWLSLGSFTKRHKAKIIIGSVAIASILAVYASKIHLSINQATLSPRGSRALKTLEKLPSLGLSAGILSPVQIFMERKDTSRHMALPPIKETWRCKDDDYDLHFALLLNSGSPLSSVDPVFYNCVDLHSLGPFLCNSSSDPLAYRNQIEDIARAFCPSTCQSRYCPGRNHGNQSVINLETFDLLMELRRQLVSIAHIPQENINGIFWSPTNDSEISVKEALSQLEGADATWFTRQFRKLANFDASSCRLEINLLDGFGTNEATLRVKKIQEIVLGLNKKSNTTTFYIVSDTLVLLDVVNNVLDFAPRMMVLVTGAVVLVVAGMTFRSILLPLRLLFTVIITLAIVSGIVYFVVQYIMKLDGVYWLVVVACGPLVIGLTIDFDIFLISKIYDARKSGLTTREAILDGIATQSRIITIAGCIMASAFASLLMSSSPVLNQIGAALVVASLVDTFFTRAFLCPALLFSAEKYNWWPGEMPTPSSRQTI